MKEEMPFDVLFVGGGPANLAGAIHLMKLARKKNIAIEVAIIEKGSEVGSHSLSGAIIDPSALVELVPDYLEKGCPIQETDCRDALYFLTANKSFRLPFTPRYLDNEGCFVVSISKLTAWLAELAEELGVYVFPGFAGVEVLYDSDGKTVVGVASGDKGVNAQKDKRANYESGINLTAKVTVFGEGPKGNLMRDVGEKLGIFSDRMPQVYETAIKEVIELPEACLSRMSDRSVIHSFGYPLNHAKKGGGFIYKQGNSKISLGLVVGLDYEDPCFEPYEAFLQFKRHPLIADIIQGGKVLQQGAKTLSAGGFYTMPQLAVNGAVFVGDGASMLNIQRLKGIHTAMKSGMLAAEAIIAALECGDFSKKTLIQYEKKLKNSWVGHELYAARNFSQALSKGGLSKFIHLGSQYLTNGRGIEDPIATKKDSSSLKKLKIGTGRTATTNPKQTIDGELYVDKLTGVYLSGTQHEEDQPGHIIIKDLNLCESRCFEEYGNPCIRFCPGSVYEIYETSSGNRRLRLNPSNCLHCKTCEIKDPYENIVWTCPEGGGGPAYSMM